MANPEAFNFFSLIKIIQHGIVCNVTVMQGVTTNYD